MQSAYVDSLIRRCFLSYRLHQLVLQVLDCLWFSIGVLILIFYGTGMSINMKCTPAVLAFASQQLRTHLYYRHSYRLHIQHRLFDCISNMKIFAAAASVLAFAGALLASPSLASRDIAS